MYKHFSGKSELLAAIIEAELARSAARFAAVPAGDVAKLDKALAAYISPEHVGHPELGCALPSLAADVARADSGVRQAFEDGLLAVQAALKLHVHSDDAAWALIAQSVGAVMLARAMQDDGGEAQGAHCGEAQRPGAGARGPRAVRQISARTAVHIVSVSDATRRLHVSIQHRAEVL